MRRADASALWAFLGAFFVVVGLIALGGGVGIGALVVCAGLALVALAVAVAGLE